MAPPPCWQALEQSKKRPLCCATQVYNLAGVWQSTLGTAAAHPLVQPIDVLFYNGAVYVSDWEDSSIQK